MCIAILNAKGTLPKQILKNCEENNPDGMGFMYAANGKINIHKQMGGFKSFYKKYVAARNQHPDKKFVLHFRIATHGKVDLENCHPFSVNRNLAFVHNGMISIDTKATPHLSDTNVFNRIVLKEMPENFHKNMAVQHLIEEYIGHSKLVFLDKHGDASIYNEHLGIWDDGNWFSNDTYEYSYSYGGFGSSWSNKNKNYNNWDFSVHKGSETTLKLNSTNFEKEEAIDCYFCAKHLTTPDERFEQLCKNCFEDTYGYPMSFYRGK